MVQFAACKQFSYKENEISMLTSRQQTPAMNMILLVHSYFKAEKLQMTWHIKHSSETLLTQIFFHPSNIHRSKTSAKIENLLSTECTNENMQDKT